MLCAGGGIYDYIFDYLLQACSLVLSFERASTREDWIHTIIEMNHPASTFCVAGLWEEVIVGV